MIDVIEKEIMKELIISKEDFEKYFNSRKIISKEEYKIYLQKKIKLLKSC